MEYLFHNTKIRSLHECIEKSGRDIFNFLPYYADRDDIATINQFINSQVTGQSKDEIDEIFADRISNARAVVLQIISQIREREMIKRKCLERIGKMEDDLKNQLRMENNFYMNCMFPESNRTRMEAESRIHELERNKSFEETSCWKDLVLLKKELMLFVKEYRSSSVKNRLVS